MIVETPDKSALAMAEGSASYSDFSVLLSRARNHQEEIKILLDQISPDIQRVIYAAESA
jgi:hypothetical protein